MQSSKHNDYTAVDVPLPGYYEVITSDFYKQSGKKRKSVSYAGKSALKNEWRHVKDVEICRQIYSWSSVYDDDDDYSSNETNWNSILRKTTVLILMLVLMVVFLFEIGEQQSQV